MAVEVNHLIALLPLEMLCQFFSRWEAKAKLIPPLKGTFSNTLSYLPVIARNNSIIQAFIFASAQGVLITTMIRSLLLRTILGNLQEIKKNWLLNLIAQKPKLTVDCKKDCSCKKSFPIQPLRGQWWLANHIQVCRKYCLAQPSIFSKEFEVFDRVTYCQFFVWELMPLECQSMFILQFDGLSIGN